MLDLTSGQRRGGESSLPQSQEKCQSADKDASSFLVSEKSYTFPSRKRESVLKLPEQRLGGFVPAAEWGWQAPAPRFSLRGQQELSLLSCSVLDQWFLPVLEQQYPLGALKKSWCPSSCQVWGPQSERVVPRKCPVLAERWVDVPKSIVKMVCLQRGTVSRAWGEREQGGGQSPARYPPESDCRPPPPGQTAVCAWHRSPILVPRRSVKFHLNLSSCFAGSLSFFYRPRLLCVCLSQLRLL